MDKEWEKLYAKVCRLQGEKKLSRYMKVSSVAAAILTINGNIYSGVSLANSCAVGLCAERNAIGTMLTNGETDRSIFKKYNNVEPRGENTQRINK